MPSPWLSPLRQPPRFASCSPQTLFCVCRCRSCSRSARSHSYSKDSKSKGNVSNRNVESHRAKECGDRRRKRGARAICARARRSQTKASFHSHRHHHHPRSAGADSHRAILLYHGKNFNNKGRRSDPIPREGERCRQNALERLSLFFLRTDTTALTDFFGAVVLETTRTPVNWVVVSANIFYYSRRVMMMIMKR